MFLLSCSKGEGEPRRVHKDILYKAYKMSQEEKRRPGKGFIIVVLRLADNQVFEETLESVYNCCNKITGRINLYSQYPMISKIECSSLGTLSEKRKNYDYNIVFLEEYQKDFIESGNVNFILSAGTEMYLKKIAEMLNRVEISRKKKELKFIFVSVRQEEQKRIKLLMEDYEVVFSDGEVDFQWMQKKLPHC